MFVSNTPVPVTIGENTILIRAKMSFGVRNSVQGAAIHIKGGDAATEIDAGAYATALLVKNILEWHGPAFADMPCNEASILQLDPEDPLVEAVLAEINARNVKKVSPKDFTPAGSPPSSEAEPVAG